MTTGPAARQLVHVHVDNHLATITLDRPDKRNALTDEMLDQLIGAVDSVEADPGPLLLQGDHGPVEYRNLTIATAK